ncbi:YicC family protein [Desulfobulbus sp. US1]|nr:YicC family protein [Desulfobulbus sp. US4]MCW5204755.1 YicC family protein [Desulfobulbus sp. N2]MCW5207159.1 YicC family protein [Desulfobulbus sp. US2]MCW5208753.1 YicC family protein [Desulfobulbus sp. US1]MCW5210476.1 YicC family protein [Desulfobulbus sp. N3]MCW5213776.1 YicC family protein [Desulfobulbus sp. US5]
MRPRSMTGFGRGESGNAERTWVVEIRTVNHRFLDQRVVLPSAFAALEEQIKKTVAGQQDRGRVDISVSLRGETSGGSQLHLDLDLARQYHACLQEMNTELGLGASIQISDLLTLRNIIAVQEQSPDVDDEWPLLKEALLAALADCASMREREGGSLKEELLQRLDNFAALVREIEGMVPEVLEQRQQELKNRITKLLEGVDIDPMRLAQETAIMADKADVTEEVVRLASHIDQFRGFMESDEAVGRRLDFLLQEFLREVNTLASKISNSAIAHLGVEMKNEIEKLREQVQNIE